LYPAQLESRSDYRQSKLSLVKELKKKIKNQTKILLTISQVLISIQSLLTDPFCAVAMETDVAEMYTNQRARFNAVARNWTSKYAMNDVRRPC
jgi:ubiquitin-conjugating enzyme E2 D/E